MEGMAALRRTGLGPGLGWTVVRRHAGRPLSAGAAFSTAALMDCLSVREQGEGDLRGHPGRLSLARARDASQRVVTVRPDSTPHATSLQPATATKSISRVTTSPTAATSLG